MMLHAQKWQFLLATFSKLEFHPPVFGPLTSNLDPLEYPQRPSLQESLQLIFFLIPGNWTCWTGPKAFRDSWICWRPPKCQRVLALDPLHLPWFLHRGFARRPPPPRFLLQFSKMRWRGPKVPPDSAPACWRGPQSPPASRFVGGPQGPPEPRFVKGPQPLPLAGFHGTGVATYFTFLRWMFKLNIVIFLVMLLFVVLPQSFFTELVSQSAAAHRTTRRALFVDIAQWDL